MHLDHPSASIDLSLICKQLCEEVRLLLYPNTTFVSDHAAGAMAFPRRRKPEAFS